MNDVWLAVLFFSGIVNSFVGILFIAGSALPTPNGQEFPDRTMRYLGIVLVLIGAALLATAAVLVT